MPLPDDFAENRNIIAEDNPDFNLDAFKRFIAEYGQEKAYGYLLALVDMSKRFGRMMYRYDDGWNSRRETRSSIGTKAKHMHEQLELFLSSAEALTWHVKPASNDLAKRPRYKKKNVFRKHSE